LNNEQPTRQPPSLDGLAAEFDSEPPEPVEGEVWRAAWNSSVQLILIIGVGDNDIDAVPLSPDVEFADDDTVPLEPPPPLTHALGVWRSLRSRLPTLVLDIRVCPALSVAAMEHLRNAPGVGTPATSVLDDRFQFRSVLAQRMEELAAATWVPANVDPVDIGARIKERGVKPSTLAHELDLTPGDITDLARGDRRLTVEQARKLAPILDLSAEQLTAVSLDNDLVWALDRPRFRKPLAERGRAAGISDEAAWRLHVATNELPVAARTTGSSEPRRRWMGLIQDYLGAS
jgi:plasmid maintenance system antidote protein VapI